MKRIIVCDSGLGGLNIAAGFFAPSAEPAGEACEVIYFNAYPEAGKGFNALPDARSQEELFRTVLESMTKYSPDLCLIACNTLSIIYERLALRYTPPFPVAGIVDAAVGAMKGVLTAEADASLLVLGTKTTVESGIYPERLIAGGIASCRIKSLACPGLATLLEADPAAEQVREKIAGYAREAAALFPGKKGRLYLAFCCTHFGFAGDLWQEEFSRLFPGGIGIVDPNRALVRECGFRAADFRYLSRIAFFPGARENMSSYFVKSAPEISAALLAAQPEPELFDFNQ